MNESVHEQIAVLEQRLCAAMRDSDVETLDALLADDLIFTDHLGGLWTKSDDLAAHRSGQIQVASVVASAQRINVRDALAVVNVRLEIAGHFGGEPASGTFRFTRVWAPAAKGRWQVVAAHSTLVSSADEVAPADAAGGLRG
jgi:ketosteroid isomerase-like protein